MGKVIMNTSHIIKPFTYLLEKLYYVINTLYMYLTFSIL